MSPIGDTKTSLQLTPPGTSIEGGSQALLKVEPERSIVDLMGSDVVKLYVGSQRQPFSVHKDLLCSTGAYFKALLNAEPQSKHSGRAGHSTQQPQIELTDNPVVFKLFVEYLYTGTVPRVRSTVDGQQQAQRLQTLCQLYAFVDRYQMDHVIRNKVMDCIQDGFYIVNKLPQGPLIKGIYSHTGPGSKLREFCIYGIIYSLRHDRSLKVETVRAILYESDEVLSDFLTFIQEMGESSGFEKDPRVRDCEGDDRCVECLGRPGRMNGSAGVLPCQFHVHHGHSEGETGSEADEGCYLWSK